MTEEKEKTKSNKGVSRREFIAGTVGGVVVGAVVGTAVGSLGFPTIPASVSEPSVPAKWDKETEVLVVGGGLAGLSAAISAADAGAKVVLLEKLSDHLSADSARCAGTVCGAGSKMQAKLGITDSADSFYNDMVKAGDARMNKDLARILADNSGATIDWLADIGVPFGYVINRPGYSDSVRRGHTVQPNAEKLVTVAAQSAKGKGVEILYNTRAKELYRDAKGKIVGVGADTTTGTITIKANKATILCSGDATGSNVMRAKFAGLGYTAVDLNAQKLGNPGNTGDGFIMAWAVGADSICMDDIGVPSGLNMVWYPDEPLGVGIDIHFINVGPIIVNKSGQRFQNETLIGGKAVYNQPDGVAFVVFDDKIARTDNTHLGQPQGLGPEVALSRFLGLQGDGGYDSWMSRPGLVKQAATIEGLAASLGVDASGLRATVDKWNSYVDAGKDPDFGRAKDPTFGLGPGIRNPPFYGLGPGAPEVTLGGSTLMVNTQHQVLDVFGNAISRLYAAGDMGKAGSSSFLLAGAHVCWAATSGRRSGANAAAETPLP